MNSASKRAARITTTWLLVAALAAATLLYLGGRPTPSDSAAPRSLDDIELAATGTVFEDFFYFNNGNPNRGFHGRLSSEGDMDCRTAREITVFLDLDGSVDDIPVAFSISDTSGNSGNFSTTNWIDPPGEDRYYAVVEPDEDKDCEGAVSETIVVD